MQHRIARSHHHNAIELGHVHLVLGGGTYLVPSEIMLRVGEEH